jgi:hypothetical protein
MKTGVSLQAKSVVNFYKTFAGLQMVEGNHPDQPGSEIGLFEVHYLNISG